MDKYENQEIYESYFRTEEVSPSELLAKLRLSNPFWQTPDFKDPFWRLNSLPTDNKEIEWDRNWLFRGQGDSRWAITPSVWRAPAPKPFELIKQQIKTDFVDFVDDILNRILTERGESTLQLEDKEKQNMKKAMQQILGEIFIIGQFIRFADKLGYATPVTNLPFFTTPLDFDFLFKIIYPLVAKEHAIPEERLYQTIWFDPAITLAQHYGIPTRLLDWTYNPLYAAYFAASDALIEKEKSEPPSHFVVFALHRKDIQSHMRVREYSPSRNNNTFIQAQDGCFILDTEADDHFVKEGNYPHLMESLFGPNRGFGENDPDRPIRFLIPISEAKEVIRLLYLEGISKATLMPTLDSVAQTTLKKIELGG